MTSYFEQIIFPPIIKPRLINVLPNGDFLLDYWIVGTNPKELWVKCPICHEVYMSTVIHISVEMIKKYIDEYKPFHYRKVIRECPNKAKHPEESWETILTK